MGLHKDTVVGSCVHLFAQKRTWTSVRQLVCVALSLRGGQLVLVAAFAWSSTDGEEILLRSVLVSI